MFKKLLTLYFTLGLITDCLIAQGIEESDSLRLTVYKAQSQPDSLKALDLYLDSEIDKDSIIKYGQHALRLSKAFEDREKTFKALVHLAGANEAQGRLETAHEYYLEALQYSLDEEDRGVVYSNIATVYNSNEDYAKSISYLQKAASIFLKVKDSLKLGTTLITKGFTHFRNENFDSAAIESARAKKVFEELNIPYQDYYWSYCIGNLSLARAAQGQIETARAGLDTALSILAKYQDDFAISDYQLQLASVLYKQGKIEEALELAGNGLSRAEKASLKDQILNGNKLLFELHSSTGSYQKALEHHIQYTLHRDSLLNADLIRSLAEKEKNSEVARKQTEVDLLASQKRNQQIISIAIGSILVLSIVAAFFIYRNYREKNKLAVELADQKSELEKLNRTKDKFFSIISHDLRGPVHAFNGISRMIKYLVTSKNTDQLVPLAEEIENSVNRLTDLLDNLLKWATQQQNGIPYEPVPFRIDQSIENLVETLNNIATGKNITVETSVPANLLSFSDPNMTETVFRNLLSNALKFTPEEGKIEISARAVDDEIEVQFSDTGIGIESDRLERLFHFTGKDSTYGTAGEKGLGLGLQLVNEFIQKNAGKLEVKSAKGEGTTFKVRLPHAEAVLT